MVTSVVRCTSKYEVGLAKLVYAEQPLKCWMSDDLQLAFGEQDELMNWIHEFLKQELSGSVRRPSVATARVRQLQLAIGLWTGRLVV